MQQIDLDLAIILGCIFIAACYDISSESYRHYTYKKHTIGLPTLITIIVLTVGALTSIGWHTLIH
jgi:tetrahydromethanopterin S-methyltransferase subunit E